MKRIITTILTVLFLGSSFACAQQPSANDPLAMTIVALLKQGKSFPVTDRFAEYTNASCPLQTRPGGKVIGQPYSICISDNDTSGYILYLASWKEEGYMGMILNKTIIYCLQKKGNSYVIDNLYIPDFDYNPDTNEDTFLGYSLARDYTRSVESYWEP